MSSTTTTWSTDTNTKSGSATTFTNTISTLKIIGAEGEDAILRLFADEGDDNADQWRIVSKASNNKLNFMSYASGAWSNVLDLFGSGTAASQYLAIQAGNKLYLDGAGGTTYLQESSDGHLEINSGTTLDLTAPTVDLNSSTEFNIDTAAYDLNASGAVTLDGATVTIKGTGASKYGDDTATLDFDGSGAVSETGMTSFSVTPSGAITLTAGATSTWSTSAGDLSVTSAGNLNLTSTVDEANSIYIHENAGASGTIKIHADQGTGADSISLVSDGGGITMTLGGGAGDDFIVDTTTLVVESDNNRVGIGIAAPETALHVVSGSADSKVWATVQNTYATSSMDNTESGIKFKLYNYSSAANIRKWAGISGVSESNYANDIGLAFYTQTDTTSDPDEVMRIDEAGNVGIGTTAPDAPLHIKTSGINNALIIECDDNTATPAPDIEFRRNPGEAGADSDYLGILSFTGYSDAGTPANVTYADIYSQIIDSDSGGEDGSISLRTMKAGSLDSTLTLKAGKVGIGTTSPGELLEVRGISFTDATCDYDDATAITMDSTSLLAVGMAVTWISGTSGATGDIPAGAYVSAITNSTTFALSTATTGGAATNQTLRFSEAGILTLSTANTDVDDGDVIGKINFQAPSEGAGTDAILVGASIHAEAEEAFSSSNNSTGLVFSTGTTTLPIERMRINQDGDVAITSTAANKPVLTIINDNDDASPSALAFLKDNSGEADTNDEIGYVKFQGYNDADELTTYADFYVNSSDISDGAEHGAITFRTIGIGASKDTLVLKSGNVGIGTSTFQAVSVGYMAIKNGTSPGALTANQVYIGARDSAGTGTDTLSTLSIFTEEGVDATALDAVGTLTTRIPIWINDVAYWIYLDPV